MVFFSIFRFVSALYIWHITNAPWHVVLVMCPIQFSILIEFQFKLLNNLEKRDKLRTHNNSARYNGVPSYSIRRVCVTKKFLKKIKNSFTNERWVHYRFWDTIFIEVLGKWMKIYSLIQIKIFIDLALENARLSSSFFLFLFTLLNFSVTVKK